MEGGESKTGLASDPQPLQPRCPCRPGTRRSVGTLTRPQTPNPEALWKKTRQGGRAGAGGPRHCTALRPPQDAAPPMFTPARAHRA